MNIFQIKKLATKTFFPITYSSVDFMVHPETSLGIKSLFSSIDLTIRNRTFPSMKYVQDQQLVILVLLLEVFLSHTDKVLLKLLNKLIPSKPMSYIHLFFFRVYKFLYKKSVTESQTMSTCVSCITQCQKFLIDLVILSHIHYNKNPHLHSPGRTTNSLMRLWFID